MTSACSQKPIIYDEIFDDNSLPSEQEIRDYAVKIGINPDTEKHLLNIALDGLMSPLPDGWKPCLDERVDRIYYYNVKTQKTQWNHPLDKHFENLVKKTREGSLSAGDDDSKTSLKEDLKSFEEAVTTSDMLPPRSTLDNHKSRLTSTPLMNPSRTLKDPSPDGRKTLNPIGRPPLPPKRKPGATSPKRGGLSGQERGLSLRLSPSPSPTRIDIDSIGVPIGLPSPELKSDKQPPPRSPAIKLTGGGSAFLKSKQKLSPSPSDDSKLTLEEPSFEIVREADSLDFLEDGSFTDTKDTDENKLKHSISLGESGFDKLTKSKRFASLQESLLSLKTEMELSNNEAKSPSKSAPLGLRGILREKPSPTVKLWDVDPSLLTKEEKEKLRMQEFKEERKQNVRFADIVTKPINIHFSKSDSDSDSNTNDSSDVLDDLILEHVYSDDELKRENKVLESFHKTDFKVQELVEDSGKEKRGNYLKASETVTNIKEPNKNILSRLTDLSIDLEKKNDQRDKKSRIIEIENNNREESDDWLTGKQEIMNENEHKIQNLKQKIFNSTDYDFENNTIEKYLDEVTLTKSTNKNKNLKSPDKPSSPKKLGLTELVEKDIFIPSPLMSASRSENAKEITAWDEHSNDSNTKLATEFYRSKLMPEMDLQKVFESVKESIFKHSEHSEGGESEEPMQTSPEVEVGTEECKSEPSEGNKGAIHKTVDKWDKYDKQKVKRFEEYHEQQKVFDEKKAKLHQEYEESTYDILQELKHQESLEKKRLYMEAQQRVSKYKEEVELEEKEREMELRNQCEKFIKDLEEMLSKEKEMKVREIKENHEIFMKEQQKKMVEEKAKFEEETKITLKTSSSQLEKIISELKQKEECEITRFMEEKSKKLDEVCQRIELEQVEKEKKHRQELAIVEAEYERVLAEKREEVEKARSEHEVELAAIRSQQEESLSLLMEQHRQTVRHLQDQCHMEEEFLRRKHSEKMDTLNAQLNRASDKEDFTQINREFEKVRCEKRLLEDKYKSLKEKYLRLKNEVRLSMERKRQAKLNRQLQQREPASTTEDTERSTDHGKPPLSRRKFATTLSADEAAGDNGSNTPKTIKRRPKPPLSVTTSSATAESSSTPPAKPKNVWIPSPQKRREGASSAEDNHTSVSEEIQLEQEEFVEEKWTQSARSPIENLRKQLEKLDDLEDQFPTSVHADTYLRYPFSGPGGSCELDFYRHRLHLEREAVRRAKQALSEQRLSIENRQLQLRHRQRSETLSHFHLEEKELTDMEVSLHRTKALLGEKIIRLRHLEQSIERASTFHSRHTHHDTSATTNTDSSGFSGSDLDLSNAGGQGMGARQEAFWTENVLLSLENINSEIREIWTILGKQQVPGLGPPPMLNYETRAIGQGERETYSLAPHRATDIADRTRKLKEWLIRTRDQQTQIMAPVILRQTSITRLQRVAPLPADDYDLSSEYRY